MTIPMFLLMAFMCFVGMICGYAIGGYSAAKEFYKILNDEMNKLLKDDLLKDD